MLKYINGYFPRAKKQQSCYKWLSHYVSHMSEGRVWGLCVVIPRSTWARLLPDLSARVPHHAPVRSAALTTNAVLSHLNWKEHSEGSWWESLPRQQDPREKLAYAKSCQNSAVIFLLPWNVSVKPRMTSQWRKWFLLFAYIPVLTDLRFCVLWDHY